jgi:polyvinyl alcohol dehydrogenase (cytochrome)
MSMMRWLLRAAALAAVAGFGALTLACDGDAGAGDPSPTPEPEPAANAWPQLGFDLAAHFHNPAETAIAPASAGSLRDAWTLDASGFVAGIPAVVDGTVYVLATGGMYALDSATGDVIWANDEIGGTSSPAYDDGALFINTFGATLVRLDAASGGEVWRAVIDPHPNASGFSSPVIARDLVIVGSSSAEEVIAVDDATFRGSIVAYDRETGDERWRYYTVEPPYNGAAVWGSPSVDLEAGLVFAGTGNNYTGEASDSSDALFAVDLETGELRWMTQMTEGDVFTIPNPQGPDYGFGTTPIVFDAVVDGEERKLLGAGQKSGMFWVVDRLTGEIVWSHEAGAGSALIGGVFNNGAYDGERIIIAANNAESDAPGGEPANGYSRGVGAARIPTSVLIALDPADGSVLWERQLPAWVWAPITIANGVGFVSADRDLQAFDTATGERLFLFETEGTIASGAAVADGRVFFGSGLAYLTTTFDNKLYALELP